MRIAFLVTLGIIGCTKTPTTTPVREQTDVVETAPEIAVTIIPYVEQAGARDFGPTVVPSDCTMEEGVCWVTYTFELQARGYLLVEVRGFPGRGYGRCAYPAALVHTQQGHELSLDIAQPGPPDGEQGVCSRDPQSVRAPAQIGPLEAGRWSIRIPDPKRGAHPWLGQVSLRPLFLPEP